MKKMIDFIFATHMTFMCLNETLQNYENISWGGVTFSIFSKICLKKYKIMNYLYKNIKS